MYKVFKYNLLDNENIQIRKPISHKNIYYSFDLYTNNNEYILLQSNKLQISFKNENMIILYNEEFCEILEKFHQNIIKKISVKYRDKLQGHKFFSNCINNNFKISNINNDDINCFDVNNNNIEYDKFLINDNIICILYIKSFWINQSWYGFNYKMIQMRREEPFKILKNLFMNDIPKPPPPPVTSKINLENNMNNLKINNIIRPTLLEIKNSKKKLRKIEK